MHVGVIVGRFQIPELHEGHVELIKHVKKGHDQVVIFIGNSMGARSKKNPLDYPTREKMIRAAFPEVLTLCLNDHPSHAEWSSNLDDMVQSIYPNARVTLYGGRDSFIPYYSGKFHSVEISVTPALSGTQVREIAGSNICVSTEFRAGMIYSIFNQYPRINPTVDIVVMRDDAILFGKKHNESLYRFPGGFVDPLKDNSFEDAVIRECKEETGLTIVDPVYLGSMCVNDWRYPDRADGSIFTSIFICHHPFYIGKEKAGDDLEKVAFIPLSEIKLEHIVPTHRPILELVLKKLGR